jgi:protein-disulfide isomerase
VANKVWVGIAIGVFSLLSITHVITADNAQIDDFDYQRFPMQGAADAPVKIAIVEDFRCGGCRKVHKKLLPILIKQYVDSGQVALHYVNYPVLKPASLKLAAMVSVYAQHYDLDYWQVADTVFAQEGVKTPVKKIAAALEETYGVIEQSQRDVLDRQARTYFEQSKTYILDLGITQIPTMIVNGVVLKAPGKALLFDRIDLLLASASQQKTGTE